MLQGDSLCLYHVTGNCPWHPSITESLVLHVYMLLTSGTPMWDFTENTITLCSGPIMGVYRCVNHQMTAMGFGVWIYVWWCHVLICVSALILGFEGWPQCSSNHCVIHIATMITDYTTVHIHYHYHTSLLYSHNPLCSQAVTVLT